MLVRRLEKTELPRGPGLFETLRLEGGRLPLLREHCARLRRSCRALGFPLPWSFNEIQDALSAEIRGRENGRMRLTCRNEIGGPVLEVQCAETEPPPDFWILHPVVANPHPLAAHKITDRQIHESRRAEALRRGAHDALLITPDGEILETTRANLFFIQDGKLHTPKADGRLLPGIMRKEVVAAALKLNLSLSEKVVAKKELAEASEIFITNAVMGLMPVAEITGLWKRKTTRGFLCRCACPETCLNSLPEHILPRGPQRSRS